MVTQLGFEFDKLPPRRATLHALWTPDDIYKSPEVFLEGLGTLFKEDERMEWKAALMEPKHLVDYFSMWANTQPHGGIIAIGVEKDGRITGCSKLDPERAAEYQQAADEQCPDANHVHKRVSVCRSDGVPDYIIMFRVYYSENKLVETVRKEAFVRSGSRIRKLGPDEKREIRIAKREILYEKEEVSLNYPEDFDIELIQKFCVSYTAKRGLTGVHSEEDVLCLNFLGARGRAGAFVPNLACAILFANHPRAIIPGSRIHFMKYEGSAETTGERLNLTENIFIDGPLPKMISEAERIITASMRKFTRLGADGKFFTRLEYPREVWLEAIVNACAHRSYNLKNMVTFVRMYDDRFVVESPGGLPPPVTPANIYDSHNPRNPYTMEALFYFDRVICAHEGTARMREVMFREGLPEPEFIQKEVIHSQVHVVLRNNLEARQVFVQPASYRAIGEDIYATLTEAERRIFAAVVERNEVNVTEIGRLLEVDWTTARKRLESMVTKGVLIRKKASEKKYEPGKRYMLRKDGM